MSDRQEATARPPGDFTVLIVDDEDLLREAISFDFRRKGFKVLTAPCGRDAIALLADTHVDVVITDVRMPNGSGIELLEEIKRKNVFTPTVIFITGFADISLEEAFDRGADAVFPKPFDRRALMEAVMLATQPAGTRYNRNSVRVDVDAEVELLRPLGQQLPPAQILNLGRGGFFVGLRAGFPRVGEVVEFSFRAGIGSKAEIRGSGVVRWVRPESPELPTGCGIEIMKLEAGSRRQFISLINLVKTRVYIPLK